MNQSARFVPTGIMVSTAVIPALLILAGPLAAGDRVELFNNTNDDNAIVLLDACGSGACNSTSGCRVVRGAGTIDVGSVPKQSCGSEVIVFSDGNAMEIDQQDVWTNDNADALQIALKPRIQVPVKVWLVRAGALTEARTAIDAANTLYDSNNTGIVFTAIFEDVATDPAAKTEIATGCESGAARRKRELGLQRLIAGSFFDPNSLNVYYVSSVSGDDRGVTCKTGKVAIIYIGGIPTSETLAHEFGHAFSLVDRLDPDSSIMQQGGSGRTLFFEGEAFRMNVQCASTINTLPVPVRKGPIRDCMAPATTDPICTNFRDEGIDVENRCPPDDMQVPPPR